MLFDETAMKPQYRTYARYIGDRSVARCSLPLGRELSRHPLAPDLDSLSVRAAANIAEWSTYLPPDCVRAMVRDGWHLTV
jgi:hypothetical protein